MDENNKNTPDFGIPNFGIPNFGLPNCGSHVKHESHLDDLYREKISNSIRIGFETLSNSLVECALILSSEDYAKSLVKERAAKKEKEEAKRKEEEEKNKKMKEDSEKILDLYKEKLKDRIYSMDISDNEKAEIFHSLIANEPYGARTLQSIKSSIACSVSQLVKNAFCDAIKEAKPELGVLFSNGSMNFDPMMLAMIIPSVKIPPISFMVLTSNDGESMTGVNPMALMQFIDTMKPKNSI